MININDDKMFYRAFNRIQLSIIVVFVVSMMVNFLLRSLSSRLIPVYLLVFYTSLPIFLFSFKSRVIGLASNLIYNRDLMMLVIEKNRRSIVSSWPV